MKILSYNVNGIRSAAGKGLFDFLANENPDVVLFQEIKAEESQISPSWYEPLGYQALWHSAKKKGYSGVGVLFKGNSTGFQIGCGIEELDAEGRFLKVDFEKFSVVSLYLPSGTSGDERQAFKMKTLEKFVNWIGEVRKECPFLVLGGDFNICREAIDIHDPIRNKDVSGFKPEERDWFARFIELGWVDSFRYFYPDSAHRYSWWTFRAGARAKNKGWRIDYLLVTKKLQKNLASADILHDIIHSDHCPVKLELKFK
jgi:exodeoxyribonuclease-3